MTIRYTRPQFTMREQESRRIHTPNGSGYSWSFDLYVCDICGALAEDTAKHHDWHVAHGDIT